MSADAVQAVAAIATFLAAALAVWATFRAPRLAAQFAEELRASAQREHEARASKMAVFATLMNYRSQMVNINAVNAINLIDVVYCDSKEVRDAWRHFHAEAMKQDDFSGDRLRERYLSIIEKMARDLGLSEHITIADIQNSYYPKALGEVDVAAFLEVRDRLQRFSGEGAQGT